MRCPDCGTWRRDEDEPCAPCSVPGAHGILDGLGVATTMPRGWEVWRAEPRAVVVRLSDRDEVTVSVGSQLTTVDEAARELRRGLGVVGTVRHETTADGWIVVLDMLNLTRPLTEMTIRRRVGGSDVDIHADVSDGRLDVAEVEAFAASLISAPPGVAARARYPRTLPAPQPPSTSLEPWSPRTRFAAPPRDEPSLGPPRAGFVRLAGLDLDARLPDDAVPYSDWAGTSIQMAASREHRDRWSVAFAIDSPIATIADMLRSLTGPDAGTTVHGAHRVERTRDGWLICCTLSWGGSRYPAVTVRRRFGHMVVDVRSTDQYLDEECVLAMAQSLMPVPGGAHERPIPGEQPVLRAGLGMGCFDGGGRDVALWHDGAAQYRGPRYRTQRGRFGQVEAALVAELHERIKSAPCCTHPEYVYNKPFELHLRVGDQWKSCAGRDIEERFLDVAALTGLGQD